MAYSCCSSCSAAIPDPARFCPSRVGHLIPESPGQSSPAAGHPRGIPASVPAACLFLVLVIAALMVQAISLQLIPAPPAANASVSPPPVLIPEITADTGISAPVQGTPSTGLNKSGNTTIPAALVRTSSTTPVPFPVPVTTGPPMPGTPLARATARSSTEVTAINATSLEARVHELVNRVRHENGRSVLGMDLALASIARAHSADMAAHGYFGHVNLQEMDPTARGAAAGYTCHKDSDPYYTYGIAENIFATYRHSSILVMNGRAVESDGKSEEEIAEETVDAWMNSPDHRENILDPGVGREGIGVAIAKDDLVFVTEDFC